MRECSYNRTDEPVRPWAATFDPNGSIHQRMGHLTQWRWGLVDCTDNRDEMVDRIISESVPANHSSLCETRDPAAIFVRYQSRGDGS